MKTLGQIAGGTGYVITPYLDFPQLLPIAADILPATKRAPWALRREVIRTLGILGALDPDRYFNHKARQTGGTGGGYFIEGEEDDAAEEELLAAKEAELKLELSQAENRIGTLRASMALARREAGGKGRNHAGRLNPEDDIDEHGDSGD